MTFFMRVRRLALVAGTVVILAFAVAPAIAADHEVDIVGLKFEPAQTTVAVGDTVTWKVTESIGANHSVTSGTPDDPDKGSAFDSGANGLADDGETFEWTFDTAGTFAYYCTVHGASMSGQVVVGEAGASPAESPEASAPVESAAASTLPEPSPEASPGESPGASPGASPPATEPPHEPGVPITPERKLLAAGILAATLVILFGAAAVWRRMNPA